MSKKIKRKKIIVISAVMIGLVIVTAIVILLIKLNTSEDYSGIYYNSKWGEQFEHSWGGTQGSQFVLNKDGTCTFVSNLLFPPEANPNEVGKCIYKIEDGTITFNDWYTGNITKDYIIFENYLFKKI